MQHCQYEKNSNYIIDFFSATFSFSQSDSLEFDKKAKDRYVAWLIPSVSRNIYGIAMVSVESVEARKTITGNNCGTLVASATNTTI